MLRHLFGNSNFIKGTSMRTLTIVLSAMAWFAVATVQVAAADSTPKPGELNVMSWNVRYDNPADGANAWRHRKDWLGSIVIQRKVDIVGFQEVLASQFEDLQKQLPKMGHYGLGRNDGKQGGEFSPIFFRKDRFELLDQSTLWLSPTPDQPGSKGWDAALPRIASWVQLKDRTTKQVLYVVNTHFDHRGVKARSESAKLLVACLGKQFADHPVILTGDFNVLPDSAAYNILVGKDSSGPAASPSKPIYRDTYKHSAQKPVGPNSTFNGFRAIIPKRRIDFIFVTDTVQVSQLHILDDQRQGRFPSDHLPVVAKVSLAK